MTYTWKVGDKGQCRDGSEYEVLKVFRNGQLAVALKKLDVEWCNTFHINGMLMAAGMSVSAYESDKDLLPPPNAEAEVVKTCETCATWGTSAHPITCETCSNMYANRWTPKKENRDD
jgi:hypothetical protein